MSARRRHDRRKNRPQRRPSRRPAKGGSRSAAPVSPGAARQITVRRASGADAWELVYPASVLRRREDMEEVRAMLDAGEIDAAIDELRWLLSGCRELLEAHRLLGEIALADGDLTLARAHLGYAYQMGLEALRQSSDFTGPLPYALEANQPFLEAGKGLAYCLEQQGDAQAAVQVARRLLELDRSDPLKLRQWIPSIQLLP